MKILSYRYKVLLLAAALTVLWNTASWMIVQDHFQSEINNEIQNESLLAEERASDLADSIRRNLAYVQSVPQLLSQLQIVKKAVRRFGPDVAAATKPVETLKHLWTNDTALNELSHYLELEQTILYVDLIYVTNAAGDSIAASNWNTPGAPIGTNYAERNFFHENKNGKPGMQYAVGKTTHIAGLFFSYPVIVDGRFMGAIVVKVDVPNLSYLTRQLNAFVVDQNGVIILAHDPGLSMHAMPGAALEIMTKEDIFARYRTNNIPVIRIEPWPDPGFATLRRVQGSLTPNVLATRDMAPYGLKVYMTGEISTFNSLKQEARWFTLLLGLLGSGLILFAASLFIYLNSLKRSKTLISAQNKRLEAFMQATNDGIHVVDGDGHLVMANDAFCKMLGYTQEELMGKHVTQWELETSDAQVWEDIQRLFMSGGDMEETVFRCKDGHHINVEVSRVPLEMEGKNLIHASARDITERKREQRTMEIMKFAMDHLGDKVIWSTADAKVIYANKAACRSLGYTMEEMLAMSIPDFDPDFRMDAWPSHWEEIKNAGSFTFESHHRAKNGAIHPVEVSVNYLRFEDEEFNCSYVRDISERKRIEENLRLANLVLQNSSEGMMVTDANNNITAVNPAFTTITGYTLDEVKGKNPRLFSAERHNEEFYRQMWESINTTGHWQGEIWDKRKSGEIHVKWFTINAIPGVDGSAQRYVALFTDITAKKQIEELVWRQANLDELTGLSNRRMFRDRLEQEIKKATRKGAAVALLLIDLDEFKEVNDTLGHSEGDLLLKEAAQRIDACIRNTDMVARLGGDEFMVILSGLSDNSHVEDIAQKINSKLAEPFRLAEQLVFVSASIGITLFPDDTSNIDVLIRNADQAMYVAKKQGRNRFSYFTQALQDAAQKRVHLISDLRAALRDEQFQLQFQPIVKLSTGHIHKAEALLRWKHPQHGLVSPHDFIQLAEETALINPIGDWVFKEAVNWAQRWSRQYGADFQISINKSPVQFRAEGDIYVSAWFGHLEKIGLPGKNIIIEITEGLLLNEELDILGKLRKFHDHGIQVSIDDFGTGYSSLAYLKKFDIDYLKIDMAFVRNMETDENDRVLCEAIIAMAHKLGLMVIAEGVETAGQCKLLAAAGCDYAQGYIFSKPLHPGEFEELMKRLQ